MDRVQIGDIVRLYGYPGLFRVEAAGPSDWRAYGEDVFRAVPLDPAYGWFHSSGRNVVERNGQPLPCLSAPLLPPADDYPHEPTFSYDDGPVWLGEHALAAWRSIRGNS